MTFIQLILHFFNLIAPALGVGLFLAWWLAMPMWWRKRITGRRVFRLIWALFWRLAGMGSLILLLGLLWYETDGKMNTYSFMIVIMGAMAAWIQSAILSKTSFSSSSSYRS